MKKPTPKTEYLSETEFNNLSETEQSQSLEVVDWEKTMAKLCEPQTTRLQIPVNKEFSRKDVVSAFVNAFELIGGTPRLALWAHNNEGDFFKLYSRLLPSQASSALGEANELVIRHVLPRGKLDE